MCSMSYTPEETEMKMREGLKEILQNGQARADVHTNLEITLVNCERADSELLKRIEQEDRFRSFTTWEFEVEEQKYEVLLFAESESFTRDKEWINPRAFSLSPLLLLPLYPFPLFK